VVLSAARVGLLGKGLDVPGSEAAIERVLSRESGSVELWLAWGAMVQTAPEMERWLGLAHRLGAPDEAVSALEVRLLGLQGDFDGACVRVLFLGPQTRRWWWGSLVGSDQERADCGLGSALTTEIGAADLSRAGSVGDVARNVLSLPTEALAKAAEEAWVRGEHGWSLVLADRWVAEGGGTEAACQGRAKARALGDVVRSSAWDRLCRSPHDARPSEAVVLAVEGPGDLAAAWEAARQGDLDQARVLVLAVPPAPHDPRTLLIQRSWTWVEGK
jgi:hypothetical protein